MVDLLRHLRRQAIAAFSIVLLVSGSTDAIQVSPRGRSVTVGAIKVLIVKVNLIGDTGPYPFSDRQFADNLAWSSERLRKFSYGLAWYALSGVAEVSIAMTPKQVCDGLGFADVLIKAELDKQRIAYADVAQFHYVLRGGAPCGWSGTSRVGGNPTWTWYNGRYVENSLILHEGAHAMGGTHSTCEGITDGSACDFYSSLGSRHGEDFHYTPPEKEAFGWLNAPGAPAVQAISADGSYTLDVYETGPGKWPKALKIRTRRAPPQRPGREIAYWISYKNGSIQVHEKIDGAGGNSIQRNTNPGGEFVPLLGAGKSFVIAPDNIRVTATSLNARSAVVAVDFDVPVAPPVPPPPPPPGINVALAKNGGVASASSVFGPAFQPAFAINGDRRGLAWGRGEGGWNDETPGKWPDWLEVHFAGARAIAEVHVFSVQDAADTPADPLPAMTFRRYGLVDFDVQAWIGSAWQTVPGGEVRGNDLVWRRITFAPITADRVRIYVHKALESWTRIAEVEVYASSR
ncbi:MAG TPA: hypothetical protein VFO19_08225 [Vicinamibacterales bacterium]|nr:hypothetical protein [Vicinamibacterales bacterium]